MNYSSYINPIIVGAIITAMIGLSAVAQKVDRIPTETKQDSVRQSMRAKSEHAQSILPALVMSDFAAIEKTAAKLKAISLKAPAGIEGENRK